MIREQPEDVRPGDEIHAAKLVDAFLKEHPELADKREELITHANALGMLKLKGAHGKTNQP